MGPRDSSLFIEWHFSGLSGNQVAEWHYLGQVAVHWHRLACNPAHRLLIGQSGIPVAEWECIGWFQIRQTFRFWPKSRLLIGPILCQLTNPMPSDQS